MQEDVALFAYLANLRDWLLDADLVVYMDDRTEECVLSDRSFELLQVDNAISLHWQVGHVKALIFKLAA